MKNKVVYGFFKIYEKACDLVGSEKIYVGSPTIDHVVDNIYIGNFKSAQNIKQLQENEITHIINCAYFLPEVHKNNFDYLTLDLEDKIKQDILPSIDIAMKFIKNVTENNPKSKIFIHCVKGKSRSASVVVAYLMLTRNIDYDEAYNILKDKRPIAQPNPGFKNQLMGLKNKSFS